MEARHSTASRRRFALEFGAAVKALRTMEARAAAAPPKAKPPPNARLLETTNQKSYRLDLVEGVPRAFRCETKHRNMKHALSDYQEALFLEWNIHGKDGHKAVK